MFSCIEDFIASVYADSDGKILLGQFAFDYCDIEGSPGVRWDETNIALVTDWAQLGVSDIYGDDNWKLIEVRYLAGQEWNSPAEWDKFLVAVCKHPNESIVNNGTTLPTLVESGMC